MRFDRNQQNSVKQLSFNKKYLKINIQKSAAFPYTNNKLSEKEIKKTISFTIGSKRIQYLGINLPEEVKDLYLVNCKTLMKET